MSRSPRVVAWGVAAIVLYLAAAAISYRGELVRGRPLYDGVVPPPPYNWVEPPPDLANENQRPRSGHGRIEFTPEGSRGGNVQTGDGQAFLILSVGGIQPREGEESVEVRITPRAPDPPATDGLRIDGNAYVFEAVYEASRRPAVLSRNANLVLRFPVHATEIVRLAGNKWEPAGPTQVFPERAQVLVQVTELGTFAAAAQAPPRQTPRWIFVAVASAVVIALLGFFARRRSGRARPV